ncbi:hypothetical protein MMC18_007018 [Xylographa bjoerkii]|nr:hypothetical protein [Xylographa bjoerkii]
MARSTRQSARLSHAPVLHQAFGIDFGTTKATISRISVESLGGNGDSTIHPVTDVLARIDRHQEWPGFQDYSVPMEAYYGPDKCRYGGEVREGLISEQIPSDGFIVKFMKLLLHNSDETRDRRTYLQEQAARLNKNPKDFVQDILVFLREQCEGINRKHLGPDIVRCVNSYVLSVPAAWTNVEQQVYLQAAKDAGMQNVSLVSEAEAVAIFTLAKDSHLWEINDVFLVCDAGGGTVDFTVFILESKDPARVKEASVAEGIMYGGQILTEMLSQLVYDMIQDVHLENMDRVRQLIATDIEEKKKYFQGFKDGRWCWRVTVPGLPAIPDKGFLKDRIILDALTVTRVFEKFVSQIVMSLREQIRQAGATESWDGKKLKIQVGLDTNNLKTELRNKQKILLTGGFGNNVYLYEELRRIFGEQGIAVMKPPHSKTLVADGSLMLKLNPGFVTKRRSTMSYGVDQMEYYHASQGDKHGLRPLFEKIEGALFVETIRWIFGRGTPICTGKPIWLRRQRTAELSSKEPWIFKDFIYTSSNDVNRKATLKYLTTAKQVAIISTDLSSISRDVFEKRKNKKSRRIYCVINYKISLEVVSVENRQPIVKFTSEVQLPGGKRCIEPVVNRVDLHYEDGFSDIGSLAEREYYRPSDETVIVGIHDEGRHEMDSTRDSLGSVDPLS